jgi:signal transduction histidine kinase
MEPLILREQVPNIARSERVLVLFGEARETQLILDVLADARLEAVPCADIDALCVELAKGVGVVLACEERVSGDALLKLMALLRAQPPWSAYPLIVLNAADGFSVSVRELFPLCNVSFLSRPLRLRSLLTCVHAALAARRRQYDTERAFEARDAFLAAFGRELRGPLGALSLAMQMLESRVPGAVSASEYRSMDRPLRSLTTLVDETLDIARITRGKVSLQLERVDLATVVRDVFETHAPRARQQGLLWELQVEELSLWVFGERQRLEQVFSNLLVNAIEHTPASGSVTVDLRRDDGAALVIVQDTGGGLSPEVYDRIFEPFAQAARSDGQTQGAPGLRLALARSVVELHGGTVHAESPGLSFGTSFIVRLPLAAAANSVR